MLNNLLFNNNIVRYFFFFFFMFITIKSWAIEYVSLIICQLHKYGQQGHLIMYLHENLGVEHNNMTEMLFTPLL